jgi:hypothetical protein
MKMMSLNLKNKTHGYSEALCPEEYDVGNNHFGTHDQASGSKTARSEVLLFLSTPIPPFLIWERRAPFLRCEVLTVKIRRSPVR